jgi:hypothetical protein
MKDHITSYDSLYESMLKCKNGVTWKPSVKSFFVKWRRKYTPDETPASGRDMEEWET